MPTAVLWAAQTPPGGPQKLGELSEAYGAARDTTKWDLVVAGTGVALSRNAAGRLRLDYQAVGTAEYAYERSVATFDAVNSGFRIDAPLRSGHYDTCGVTIDDWTTGTGNLLHWTSYGPGAINAEIGVNGTFSNPVNVDVSTATNLKLGIGHDGTNWFFEYSLDGTTWVKAWTGAALTLAQAGAVKVYVGGRGRGVAAAAAEFDNLNPVAAVPITAETTGAGGEAAGGQNATTAILTALTTAEGGEAAGGTNTVTTVQTTSVQGGEAAGGANTVQFLQILPTSVDGGEAAGGENTVQALQLISTSVQGGEAAGGENSAQAVVLVTLSTSAEGGEAAGGENTVQAILPVTLSTSAEGGSAPGSENTVQAVLPVTLSTSTEGGSAPGGENSTQAVLLVTFSTSAEGGSAPGSENIVQAILGVTLSTSAEGGSAPGGGNTVTAVLGQTIVRLTQTLADRKLVPVLQPAGYYTARDASTAVATARVIARAADGVLILQPL